MAKRVVTMLMAVIMLCSMYYLARRAAVYTMTNRTGREKSIVVIDAGHGGIDPGKIGINQAKEKDINLQIALRVRTLLEQNDIEVVMTRERDEGLYEEGASNKKVQDMKRRIERIAKAAAPLTVSIHQNSYSDERIHGAQVFYYTSSTEGKAAALLMQQQLAEGLDPDNRRQAKANDSYYLLKKSPTPAIIVECGFLSNYEEAQKLTQEKYQEQVAFQITLGILRYLSAQSQK
ncbi:MAG: N-acetylmuramoyl-L-alanine amidase [Lachnospiraceae bacterium]|nr:N-acetylmuramoyl-L-alanine amidase [Lachnospiraceae bacterium]